jgi:UPF0176 protein
MLISCSSIKIKTIVSYCTGGINCEKASAYIMEKGFKDVHQFDRTIFNFIIKFPDVYWEGAMFVLMREGM